MAINEESREIENRFHPVMQYSARVRDELYINTEIMGDPQYKFVGWIDLMGAGHLMTTSVHKTANFVARLHMAVELSRADQNFEGDILAINDGIFIASASKKCLMNILRMSLVRLAAHFIATPRLHDRFLVRSGIAYGPVYRGEQLQAGMRGKLKQADNGFMSRVLFGAPIIQAYKAEALAPPFGVAVHESARAFSGKDERPFQMTHWLWWQENDDGTRVSGVAPLTDMKDCLSEELKKYYEWMDNTAIFSGVPPEKISMWRVASKQYFGLA